MGDTSCTHCTMRQEAGKSARRDIFDEWRLSESLLDPKQTSATKQRTESSKLLFHPVTAHTYTTHYSYIHITFLSTE